MNICSYENQLVLCVVCATLWHSYSILVFHANHGILFVLLADPYVAAENFLSVNNLPAHYLDEVAQFIIKNAGEYSGFSSTSGADPFTGKF